MKHVTSLDLIKYLLLAKLRELFCCLTLYNHILNIWGIMSRSEVVTSLIAHLKKKEKRKETPTKPVVRINYRLLQQSKQNCMLLIKDG